MHSGYLGVSWLNIQNVSLGGGPLEGQVRGGVAKGKWRLIVGQTHDIDGHLGRGGTGKQM